MRPRDVTRNRQPQRHAPRKALAARAAIRPIEDVGAFFRRDAAARLPLACAISRGSIEPVGRSLAVRGDGAN
jgi:hypothetical protein